MKTHLSSILLLFLLISFWSCENDKNPDEPVVPEMSTREKAYQLLNEKFIAGAVLHSFTYQNPSTYIAEFEDGTKAEFSGKEIKIIECTTATWPAVKCNQQGVWLVNGTSTGVSSDSDSNQVVALVYDKQGLYVRTSKNNILFFHHDGVRHIGCYRLEACLNPALSSDIICQVDNGTVTASLPTGISPSGLIATVGYRGSSLKLNNVEQTSGITPNNYSSALTFVIQCFDGTLRDINVAVSGFRNIPVIRIVTTGNVPITSKEDYVTATLEITDDDHLYSDKNPGKLVTEIRGRGNSTWGMPKKPYKIKLDKKNALLGMSNDKEWALLANYSDKTLMRNYAAFEISRATGMPWTPLGRPVELYLNGEYLGTYTLTEQVKVSDERVNVAIVKESDNSGDAISGGYFMEIDSRHDGDTWFDTSRGLPIVFKEPKIPTTAQLDYIKSYFRDIETALYGSNFSNPTTGYAQYIDLKSFADNYLVQELTKNIDGNLRLSTFFSKARGGKLAFSNVWDFDIAIGNADYFAQENGSQYDNGPTGFYVKNFRWYQRMFEDPAFVAEVKKEWSTLYAKLPAIIYSLRQYAIQLEPAQKRNFQKWNILNQWVWPNVKIAGSYKGEVDYMIQYLRDRSEWLNTEINKL